MILNPLGQPLGSFMRPTMRVAPEDSLEQAARRMKENGSPVLPVVDGHFLKGIVTEQSLAAALGRGAKPTDSVESACDHQALPVASYSTGAEALRRFDESSAAALV